MIWKHWEKRKATNQIKEDQGHNVLPLFGKVEKHSGGVFGGSITTQKGVRCPAKKVESTSISPKGGTHSPLIFKRQKGSGNLSNRGKGFLVRRVGESKGRSTKKGNSS